MIVEQVKTTIAGIALAIAVIITGFVTWSITSNHYKGVINEIEKTNAEQVAGYERSIGAIKSKAQEETAAAMQRMKDAQNALAELDKQTSQELANAKSENDNLRRDVANGSRRVRILQTNLAGCNANTNTAGGNTSTRSMGDAATVELSAIAADTIFSIREGIISDQAKLVYLQSYVKDIVKQCKRL